MTSEASTAPPKAQKRNASRCANSSNIIIVDELQAMRKKMRPNSNLSSNYQRAITSIQKFAFPIRSGSEARCLKNIGNYMANQIQSILNKESEKIGNETKQNDSDPIQKCNRVATDAAGSDKAPCHTRLSKEYVPAFQKQPWFILSALNEKKAISDSCAIHLKEIYQHAKSYGLQGTMNQLKTCCAQLSSSHQVIDRNVYGAWFLTGKGKQSAQRCALMAQGTICDDFSRKTAQVRGVHDTLSDQCSKTHTGSDVENIDPEAENEPHIDEKNTRSNLLYNEYLCRDKDSWTLVLLLDHREVLSRRNRSILERKLTERGVTCEVRGLHIGDMIWIARRTRGERIDEFVLNVIVERKEVRDLSGSIIDRRFAEQKHRLQACGLYQVVYLVEGSMTQQTTITKDGMEDALCLTEFRNDFLVHMSQNADETVAFLSAIHRRLLARFPRDQCFNPEIEEALCASKFLSSETTTFTALFAKPLISFGEFNRKFQKRTNFSVSEMYQRMLTQIPSLSTSKIAAIVHQFKNFTELIEAINPSEQLGGDEMDASVSRLGHIRYGENNRLLDTRTRNIIRILLQSENYELS